MRIRSWLAAFAGLVPLLLLGTGGPALQAEDAAWISSVAVSTGVSSATVPTPSLSESPYYPVPQLSTANVTIKQVSCVNRSFCMGVGFVNKNFNAGVAEIWNGSSWSIQGVPDTSILMGVSCPTANFCLAVGGNDQDNGTMSSWTPAAGWQTDLVGGQEVTTSVSCPATNWCWAVGRSYPARGAQGYYGTVAFWGGSPADGNAIGNIQQLTGISCPTTSWCLAVGNTTYNGSSYYDQGTTWGAYATWTPVGGWTGGAADGGATTWDGVSCSGADSCLAVGNITAGGNAGIPAIGTYTGSWSFRYGGPSGITTWDGVSCASGGNCWFSGFGQPRRGGYYANAVEVRDASGTWQSAKAWNSDTYLESVACTPGSYCIAATGGNTSNYPNAATPTIIDVSSGATLTASGSELPSPTGSPVTATAIVSPWGQLGASPSPPWSITTTATQLYATSYYAKTHTVIGSWHQDSPVVSVPPNDSTPGIAPPSTAAPTDPAYANGILAGTTGGWITANGVTSSPNENPGWPVVSVSRASNGYGYFALGNGGEIGFFALNFFGAPNVSPAVLGGDASAPFAIQATPDNGGYWVLMTDGMVIPFGDAMFYGNPFDESCILPGQPACTASGGTSLASFGQWDGAGGLASTSDGQGYWIASADGAVQAFGDAMFTWDTFSYGVGGLCPQGNGGVCPRLNGYQTLTRRIDAAVPNPQDFGYYLAARDGGIFAGAGDANCNSAYASGRQFTNQGGDPMYVGLVVGPQNDYCDLVDNSGGVLDTAGSNPPGFPGGVNTAGGEITTVKGD